MIVNIRMEKFRFTGTYEVSDERYERLHKVLLDLTREPAEKEQE